MPAAVPRRRVVGGGLAGLGLLLVGCRSSGSTADPGDAVASSAATPDPTLLTAIAGERALLAAYDAGLRSSSLDRSLAGPMRMLRADHQQHLTALLADTAGIGRRGTPVRRKASEPGLAVLLGRERQSGHELTGAALAATGRVAPLLASIAASHAGHADRLAELVRGQRRRRAHNRKPLRK